MHNNAFFFAECGQSGTSKAKIDAVRPPGFKIKSLLALWSRGGRGGSDVLVAGQNSPPQGTNGCLSYKKNPSNVNSRLLIFGFLESDLGVASF